MGSEQGTELERGRGVELERIINDGHIRRIYTT